MPQEYGGLLELCLYGSSHPEQNIPQEKCQVTRAQKNIFEVLQALAGGFFLDRVAIARLNYPAAIHDSGPAARG